LPTDSPGKKLALSQKEKLIRQLYSRTVDFHDTAQSSTNPDWRIAELQELKISFPCPPR
jgi:hypothetical protein